MSPLTSAIAGGDAVAYLAHHPTAFTQAGGLPLWAGGLPYSCLPGQAQWQRPAAQLPPSVYTTIQHQQQEQQRQRQELLHGISDPSNRAPAGRKSPQPHSASDFPMHFPPHTQQQQQPPQPEVQQAAAHLQSPGSGGGSAYGQTGSPFPAGYAQQAMLPYSAPAAWYPQVECTDPAWMASTIASQMQHAQQAQQAQQLQLQQQQQQQMAMHMAQQQQQQGFRSDAHMYSGMPGGTALSAQGTMPYYEFVGAMHADQAALQAQQAQQAHLHAQAMQQQAHLQQQLQQHMQQQQLYAHLQQQQEYALTPAQPAGAVLPFGQSAQGQYQP